MKAPQRTQAQRLLSADRLAFIALCPSLGLRPRIATAAFASPRHIDAALWILDAWMSRGMPPAVGAYFSESQWPMGGAR